MTYHGSWNRSAPTGAKVVRVRVENGRPTAVEDFVTGWQLANGSRWGRPVGIIVAAGGALLIAGDQGKRIWGGSYGPQRGGSGDRGRDSSVRGGGCGDGGRLRPPRR